jgi:HEAT repeat protein
MERGSVATQAAVSNALAYVGDQRSIEPLLAALFHPERTDLARAFAAVALGNAADKESLPWNAKLAAGLNYRAATSTLFEPSVGKGVLDIF